MDALADLYTRLEVDRDATTEEIASAYRRLSRSVHPNRGPERPPDADERYRALQEAYDMLHEPDSRRGYDKSIGQRPQSFGIHTLLDDGSTYGRILRTIERVHAFDLVQPTIVVIGDESHGKSSLMERITMRDYFKTGRGFCTKVPVRMMLRTVADGDGDQDTVYVRRVRVLDGRRERRSEKTFPPRSSFGVVTELPEKVKGYIQRLYTDAGLDTNDAVLVDEEVEIEIRATDVPNLDLVDLPGIVQSVPLNKPTLAITERYLRAPTLSSCASSMARSTRPPKTRPHCANLPRSRTGLSSW